MDEIKQAIDKAESFLYQVVEQKEDYKNLERNSPELLDYPLRFEAYSYFGRKDPHKKSDYSKYLWGLWKEWVELNKAGKIGGEDIFWPFQPDNEIENHVSMFRAKEVFQIIGFKSFFSQATERIKNSVNMPRCAWQIVRSQSILSDCASIFDKLEDTEEFLVFDFRSGMAGFIPDNSYILKIIQSVFYLRVLKKLKRLRMN